MPYYPNDDPWPFVASICLFELSLAPIVWLSIPFVIFLRNSVCTPSASDNCLYWVWVLTTSPCWSATVPDFVTVPPVCNVGAVSPRPPPLTTLANWTPVNPNAWANFFLAI